MKEFRKEDRKRRPWIYEKPWYNVHLGHEDVEYDEKEQTSLDDW